MEKEILKKKMVINGILYGRSFRSSSGEGLRYG